MIWRDDEEITPKTKRAVGRPVENPFCSTESEEEFVRCGEAMLRLYYKEGGPNTRHDFVFGPSRDMSKTLFWSIIFLYYTTEKHMQNNLQGFLFAITRHFGAKVTSDRTSISKCVKLLNKLTANFKHSFELSGAAGKQQEMYRSYYQYVVKKWNETVRA